MQPRSLSATLALSAALTLTIAALAPTATLAKGPGPGAGACDGDCAADEPQLQQQARARDASGGGAKTAARTATRVKAGAGQQAQARAAVGGSGKGRDVVAGRVRRDADPGATKAALRGQGQSTRQGAGKGPNEDGQRGPGSCEECTAEMGTLSDEQAAGLLYMANEEKLAHDLYAAFAKQYELRIFENIASAEARHQEAVTTVLDRYGLEDPAMGLPAGEFSDPIIAGLYADLIEQGSASLEEAIAVGMLVEETDIADLESRLDGLEETAPDVHEMYSHLRAGSENHLAAFEGWL